MTNPYTLLRVPPEATPDEIEAAYERLFDKYEVRAQDGDADAISMLDQLNGAIDLLSDPERRAALDAELQGEAPVLAPSKGRRTSQVAVASGRAPASLGAQKRARSQVIRTRQRVQSRGGREIARPVLPLVPIFLIGLLAFGLAIAVTYFFVTRNPGTQAENRGSVVATVNDQPIYQQDYLERVAFDLEAARNEPLLSALNPTVVTETIKSDALDRLINFEVLLQQARKEGLYPASEAEQRSLIEEAKSREVQGITFQEFLKQRNLTQGQYSRRVIRNVVYTVMADAHMPKTGTADEKRSAFFQWICEARKNYNVKINLTFAVQNPPCTSDLPPELPLPGIDSIPEPEGTAVPSAPQGPVGPPAAPTPTK